MRKYKFRGICDEEETTHYGKWIHGYLGYEDCINPIEIVGDKDGDIEDYGIYDELKFIKVRKKTIGQFTGLHDKNGVEIYEGDIVIHTNFPNDKQEVRFEDGCFVVHQMALYSYHKSVIEVIGNIHVEVEE